MRRHLRTPSFATVVSCVALFVALGGTGYAAMTVAHAKDADKLGGKPANAYLLKSGQPVKSTGLVRLAAGKTKTLLKLAGGELTVYVGCTPTQANVFVTPHGTQIYHLSNTTPVPSGTPIPIQNASSSGPSGYVDYLGAEFATPKGDYYFDVMAGIKPGSQYHADCIFDVRAIS